MSKIATPPPILPKAGLSIRLPWNQLYNLYSLISQQLLNKVSKPQTLSSNFSFLLKPNFSRSTSLWKYLVGVISAEKLRDAKMGAQEVKGCIAKRSCQPRPAWGGMGLMPSGAGIGEGTFD